jgi:hypothetical protein
MSSCFRSNSSPSSLVAGGTVSKVNPELTGLNPAWRKALTHVVWGTGWDEGAPVSEINKLRAVLAESLQNFTDLTGSSAYYNEARLLTFYFAQIFTLNAIYRHPCLNSTPSTPSLALTMINLRPSRILMIPLVYLL